MLLIVEGGVGTGCSCGVDSFNTIFNHIDCGITARNLTHLAVFNSGSFNSVYKEAGMVHVKEAIWKRAETVAKILKLPLVKVNTNISMQFPQNHLLTHTYTDAFVVYSLQKLWRHYYYASTYDNEMMKLSSNLSNDSSYYEVLLLECLSISTLKMQLDGATGTRNDKVRNIAQFPIARKYLHVCTANEENCGRCEKCRRTMLMADAEKVLDAFSDSFPVDYYKSHRSEYYDFLCKQNIFKKAFYEETYEKLYSENEEEFEKFNKEYTPEKLLRKCSTYSDWLSRWRKYAEIYKRSMNPEFISKSILDNLRDVKTVAFYGDGDLRRYLSSIIDGNIDIKIQYIVEDGVTNLDYPVVSRTKEDFSDVDIVIITDVLAGKTIQDKIDRGNGKYIMGADLFPKLGNSDEIYWYIDNEIVRNSISYKLGLTMTYVPRKIYHFIKK